MFWVVWYLLNALKAVDMDSVVDMLLLGLGGTGNSIAYSPLGVRLRLARLYSVATKSAVTCDGRKPLWICPISSAGGVIWILGPEALRRLWTAVWNKSLTWIKNRNGLLWKHFTSYAIVIDLKSEKLKFSIHFNIENHIRHTYFFTLTLFLSFQLFHSSPLASQCVPCFPVMCHKLGCIIKCFCCKHFLGWVLKASAALFIKFGILLLSWTPT